MTPEQAKKHRLFVYAMPIDDKEAIEYIDDILNKGAGWAGGCFSGLGNRYAAIHGLYAWFVDQDLAAAKQWFYLAAKLIAVSTTKPVGFSDLWIPHDFMYPLLSDSPEAIKLFSEVEIPAITRPKPCYPKNSGEKSLLAQLTIKRDDVQLAKMIDQLDAKLSKRKKPPQFDMAYVDFYHGLLSGNIAQMEQALAYFTTIKYEDSTTQDFLAFYAVVLCKLAWLRGFEVQVDHPRVPMAFMPVNPLPFYDDVYEFLKPGWVAPPPPPEYAAK